MPKVKRTGFQTRKKPNNRNKKGNVFKEENNHQRLLKKLKELQACAFPSVSDEDHVHWYAEGDYKQYLHLFKAEVEAQVNPYSLYGLTHKVITSVGAIIGYKEKKPNVCKTPLCISDRSEIYRIKDEVANKTYIMKSMSSLSEMRNHMCITRKQKGGIKIVPEFICGKIFMGYPSEHTFLMEDLEGINLLDFYQQNKGTLTEEQLQTIFNILKTKVDALHTLGYVHMDLKPQNCIVTVDAAGTLDIFLIDLESVDVIGEKYRFHAETPGYSYYLNTVENGVYRNPKGFYNGNDYYYPKNRNRLTQRNKEIRIKELRRELKGIYERTVEHNIGTFQPRLNLYSLEKIQSMLGLPPPTV